MSDIDSLLILLVSGAWQPRLPSPPWPPRIFFFLFFPTWPAAAMSALRFSSSFLPSSLRRASPALFLFPSSGRNFTFSPLRAFASAAAPPPSSGSSGPPRVPSVSSDPLSLLDVLPSQGQLPIVEDFIPRCFPFPVVLRSSLPPSENIDLHQLRPHDVPFFKTSVTVDIRDLPLSSEELAIFKSLVGRRLNLVEFNPAFDRGFNTPDKLERMKNHKGKNAKNPYLVSFVCRHLPSQRSSENGAFWLLEETLKQAKLLAQKFPGKIFESEKMPGK